MNDSAAKAVDEKFCGECGSVIKIKAEICPRCGVRQLAALGSFGPTAIAANGKSRVTAAVLAFLLGGLGVHKFYLGQIGMGFLYLIFFWTFIPAIIAFVEFVLFLTMTDDDFNQKFGRA